MQLSFARIAIVNRGEPAMRLLHAVRELEQERGAALRTIALFTEPDRSSLFVREADEAVCLGEATFVDPRDGQRKSSYLDYDALERALVASRAEAAWVGWGFVAEHAEFADLCERLGIVFIGPDGGVMRKVGDKIASKLLAEQAGVPVAPWSGGAVASLQDAQQHAARLGFPLMIKATAGGGGRGVRRVTRMEELAAAFASAQAEALKFFGSAIVFLERAIVGARHVEVQVIADAHGTSWALGVRDCTIQRRNQKVLEEAPCPVIGPELEAELRAAAVRMCETAGYRNAGTVEFLFDERDRSFFFMEMNTRLQVEHPVTEATTGVDLVKLQIHVASGGRLEGAPPATVGHAIEVRLNAEDPDNAFAPAPGRIEVFEVPTGPGLRIDTGVRQGDSVAPEFDSMIAKLIAHGRNREEALGRLRRALLESVVVIKGGTSNKAFLLELLSHPDVVASRLDIGWLDRTWGAGPRGARKGAALALVQAAVEVHERESALEKTRFFASASRGRPQVRSGVGHSAELRYEGNTYELDVRRVGPREYRVIVDGKRMDVLIDRRGRHQTWLTVNGARHRVVSVADGPTHLVEVDGVPHRISADEGGVVRAPAPAVVLGIHVQPGDIVQAGDRLVVLEAMKMEMAVLAPHGGKVRQVLVRPNVQVAAGAELVVVEQEAGAEQAPGSERVVFEDSAAPKNALDDLRRLVLGYDIDPKESKKLAAARNSSWVASALEDDAEWSAEDGVLRVLSDVLLLHAREASIAFEQTVTPEETLQEYLRGYRSAGKGLPERFVQRLRRALELYGVTSLEPTPELEEALLFVHKAYRRVDEMATHAFDILERRLRHVDACARRATPAQRELLDQLIEATQSRYLTASDMARELRYRMFDRPLLEGARNESFGLVKEVLSRLAIAPGRPSAAADLELMVDCPHPLFGLLANPLTAAHVPSRQLCLSVLLQRHYRICVLEDLEVVEIEGRSVASAEWLSATERGHVVATYGLLDDMASAVASAGPVVARNGPASKVSLDLFAVADHEVDAERVRQAMHKALQIAALWRPLERISVAIATAEPGARVLYLSWLPGPDGYAEDRERRGIHPMVAQRLELWRLKNFDLEQISASEDIHLFHAVAKDNPKDERLFSFVDVRDLTPVRNERGEVTGLPILEHLFLDALAGIREFQARRSARDRLHWNRVVLFLWPEFDLKADEMMRIARRLATPTKSLGLEKTVVRVRVRDSKSGLLTDRVLHISNRAGTGLRVQFDSMSAMPIRPLTSYAQKVVQLRRMQMVYPYEIIRMLTPAREGEQAEFPTGEFVEHDLDKDGKLVPLRRAPGENVANVVVGVIRNITAAHPEGMTRVMLLGDASREMGALAEPECRRIIAGLDLAQRMGVPVEWFPVSSGAKISMDVGTEGLDWVARVLRRIIEFTQAGGEINVIVSGVNVGGQSYWNAEATMLMHTRGILVMTPQGSMVLTGKRALDYSGGVSAETNQGIGGFDRIMGVNGQAQYAARDIADACHILLRHYEHTYVAPGERFPRRLESSDPKDRDISACAHQSVNGTGFLTVADVFSTEKNPGRKKPFDTRSVMRAVVDRDHEPFERWMAWRHAENAVVWDARLGGMPVCMIGIESKPLPRFGPVPGDGPEGWTGGTLFPQSSKKVARAINAASGNRPVVVLANLSGFDGSPESMRELQLEYGAEIGRAVVNFDGPIVFTVISRYHGGAYVVFSCGLNDNLQVAALEGSHASVIGGAPAAAVVFPAEVKARTMADPRVREVQALLSKANDGEKRRLSARFDEVFKEVYAEKQGEVADNFDRVHSVQRALEVGSLHSILPTSRLRPYLIDAVERGVSRTIGSAPRVLQTAESLAG